MRKKLGLPSLAALCFLASSFASAETAKPYKVIEITDYTGAAMNVTAPAGQGFEAYIDYLNRNGGVNGRKIELDIQDEQSNPKIGSVLFQSAVSSDALSIVHFGLSVIEVQNKSLLTDSGVPFLSCCTDDIFLYPSPSSNMFMINLSASQAVSAMLSQAEQLINGLSGKHIALAVQQTAYNETMLNEVKARAEKAGYKVVAAERFQLGIPNFSSQGARIALAKPDVVLVLGNQGDAPILVKGISDAGVTTAPIIGFSGMSSTSVFQKINLPNFFAYRPYEMAADVPSLQGKVADQYKSSMTGSLWSLGWTTGVVLVEGLKRCGADCTREKLIAALERGEPINVDQGVLYGPVILNKTRHAGLTSVQAFKMEGGKVVADGKPISVSDR